MMSRSQCLWGKNLFGVFSLLFCCFCLHAQPEWLPVDKATLPSDQYMIGPCGGASSLGSSVYAFIDNNLKVVLYAETRSGLRSTSFDLGWIIDNKGEAHVEVDFPALLDATRKRCEEHELYTFAAEAGVFLLDQRPRVFWHLWNIAPSFVDMMRTLIAQAKLVYEFDVLVGIAVNAINPDNSGAPVFLEKRKGHLPIINVSFDFLSKKSDKEQQGTMANVLMYLRQVYLKKPCDEQTKIFLADIATVLAVGDASYAVYLHKGRCSETRKKLMLATEKFYKEAQEHLASFF